MHTPGFVQRRWRYCDLTHCRRGRNNAAPVPSTGGVISRRVERFFNLRDRVCHSRRIMGEDEVAGFFLRVTGKAGFHKRLVAKFAVFEVTEPPAARRGVLL